MGIGIHVSERLQPFGARRRTGSCLQKGHDVPDKDSARTPCVNASPDRSDMFPGSEKSSWESVLRLSSESHGLCFARCLQELPLVSPGNPLSRRIFRMPALIAGLLSLLFMLNAAGVLSRNIGLFHDELWDFIPAVGMIHAAPIAGWLEFRIFGYPLPLVSGPYQGALKAWVSAPLLMITGTTPRMLLAVNVLFAMVYLIALYWAILPIAGRKWAWLVFASPFVDTNFLITAPMDTGPSLFQYIFISLTLGVLFRYLSSSDMKYYRMIWFFTGCVLAQKLTSIPVVIAFIILTGILSFGRFRQVCRYAPNLACHQKLLCHPGPVLPNPDDSPSLLFLQKGIFCFVHGNRRWRARTIFSSRWARTSRFCAACSMERTGI